MWWNVFKINSGPSAYQTETGSKLLQVPKGAVTTLRRRHITFTVPKWLCLKKKKRHRWNILNYRLSMQGQWGQGGVPPLPPNVSAIYSDLPKWHITSTYKATDRWGRYSDRLTKPTQLRIVIIKKRKPFIKHSPGTVTRSTHHKAAKLSAETEAE